MPTSRRRRARFGLGLLVLLLSGCANQRYRMEFVLPAGKEAELRVLGNDLRIEVENAGPDTVLLEVDSPDDGHDEQLELDAGKTERSLPGPVLLHFASEGEGGTSVVVRAWGCDGMALDQTPAPRTTKN